MGVKVCPERNRHGEPPSFATLNQTHLKPARPKRVVPSRTWYYTLCTRRGIRGTMRGIEAILLRSAVLATTLVSLSLPALARGDLNERQKRKELLPAVQATTECLAQEILRSPTALNYARQNKWVETVESVPEACKAEGRNLIAEHDRLYGPRTGKAFVDGPYASDLPRALKARIRPALKRQTTQFATVEEVPEPAPAPADTRREVTPPLPPVQSRPLVEDASALRAQTPTGPAQPVAVKKAPEAKVVTPPVKPAAREVTAAKPPGENRLDQPTHPNRAYSLACVAVFAGAALFGTGHALGLRVRGLARWRLRRSRPG